MEFTTEYISGLPDFLLYFFTAMVMLVVFSIIYSKITPHKEWKLVRENNAAAVLAYGGSILGFVLPLHSAISLSINIIDCVIWSGIAFVIQITTFFAIRLVIKDLSERISKGEVASGAIVGILSLAVGLLNAASMSY